jgi:GDPmannose 4,6-dehydratase
MDHLIYNPARYFPGLSFVYVETDPRFLRPVETNLLCANPTKARIKLGWKPTVMFDELVKIMVDADLKKQPQR